MRAECSLSTKQSALNLVESDENGPRINFAGRGYEIIPSTAKASRTQSKRFRGPAKDADMTHCGNLMMRKASAKGTVTGHIAMIPFLRIAKRKTRCRWKFVLTHG